MGLIMNGIGGNGSMFITAALPRDLYSEETAPGVGVTNTHTHAHNPDGSRTMVPDAYSELRERLHAETGAVIQPPTSGGPASQPVEKGLSTVLRACSLNMGLLECFMPGERFSFSKHRSDIERFTKQSKVARFRDSERRGADHPEKGRGPLPREALVAQFEDVLVDARGLIYRTDKNHGLSVLRYSEDLNERWPQCTLMPLVIRSRFRNVRVRAKASGLGRRFPTVAVS